MAKKNAAAPSGDAVIESGENVTEDAGNVIETGETAAAEDDARAEAERIIAQARVEADAIIAEAKKEAKKAAKTEKAPAVPPGEELVSIRLFKDNDKYKDDVFVAVNGERVQIRRGETVMIKRKFADVLEQSMKQDMATAGLIERESSRYDEEAKMRGL